MTIEYHLDEIDAIAFRIIGTFPEVKHFAFYADMGSGKTTLINAMCKVLGVSENTGSPTFSIINEYRGKNDTVIYHTDWYRLKDARDAIDAGVEDILFHAGAYCFIEWPEIAESLLPLDCLRIRISMLDNEIRRLEF